MNDIEDVFVKRGVKESVQVARKDVKSEEENKLGANFHGKTAKQELLEKLLESYEKHEVESKGAEKESREIRKTSRSWKESQNSNGMLKKKKESNDKRTNFASSNRSSEGKTDIETIIEQVSEEQNFEEKHNAKKSISTGEAIRGSINPGMKKSKKALDSNEDSYSYEYHDYECTGDSNEDCSNEDVKEAAHIKLTSVV